MPHRIRLLDAQLFEAVHAHSLSTRGLAPQRVTVEYDDGSRTMLPVPGALPHAGAAAVEMAPAWPPAEGWAFRPGEAAFNGSAFRIVGKLGAILRELATRPGEAVTGDRLKLVVWGEAESSLVDDANVQGHLSMLRKLLRGSLGLGDDVNPIAFADGAYRLAIR